VTKSLAPVAIAAVAILWLQRRRSGARFQSPQRLLLDESQERRQLFLDLWSWKENAASRGI